MPTPNKPAVMLRAEGRSHRTKAELELREKGEAALATGEPMKARKEVKANKKANSEFRRVSKLLECIGKNDALIEGVINRYCQITAEVLEFEETREEFQKGIAQLQQAYEDDTLANPDINDRIIPTMDYFRTLSTMESALLALDKRIHDKRKMLLDIEKENIMTVAAQLRSIPKKVEDEEESDPMAALFKQRQRGA